MRLVKRIFSGCLFLLLSGCLSLPSEITDAFVSIKDGPRGTKVAEALVHKGDYDSAARIYQELLVKRPTEAVLWERYADILYALEAYPEALEAYARFTDIAPEACSGYIGAGRSSLKLARPAYAGVYFKRCQNLETDNKPALLGLAISNDMAGNYSQSSDYYRQAIALSPGNLMLRNNFALSLLLAGDTDQAIHELSQIAFGAEATVRIRQNLALAYGLKGDESAAFQVASLDLPPDTVENNLKYYAFIRHSGDTATILRMIISEPERR